tara:strand:- start:1805 stop:1996 length:192 start_codon:yes stop_codon:yes gene_type:complete
MFSVIYKFEIKPDRKDSFEKSWKDLTHLIYDYAGSLGSRKSSIEVNILWLSFFLNITFIKNFT